MSNQYEKFWSKNDYDPMDDPMDHMFTSNIVDRHRAREWGTTNFSWAVPAMGAIKAIVNLSPIVEIGAGGGYWAQQLRKHGANVTAFDKHGCSTKRNRYVKRIHTRIRRGGPKVLRKRAFKDHTLFLCWPPYDTSMALDCLQHFRGEHVCYIGEGWKGCTGCDEFHNVLQRDYEEVGETPIPQWNHLHDRLLIYKRKEHGSGRNA